MQANRRIWQISIKTRFWALDVYLFTFVCKQHKKAINLSLATIFVTDLKFISVLLIKACLVL